MEILKKDIILVTGSTGFLGSHLLKELKRKYKKNKIIALSSRNFDLTKEIQAFKMFKKYNPDIVIHLGAYSGGIETNRKYQADFFYINLIQMINIFNFANKFKIKKLLYPIGGCSYPNSAKSPIKEIDIWNGLPVKTSLGYSMAKKMGIIASWCYEDQYKLNSSIVIPGNMYGEYDNFSLESSHVIPALIRKFYEAKINNTNKVELWGSGKPIRDFVYVGDVAKCMVYFLTKKIDGPVNISCGKGFSILYIAKIIKNIIGYKGKIIWDKSKPDGQKKRIMNVSKMLKLGFKTNTNLKNGLRKTVFWFEKNYDNKKNPIRFK